MEETYTSYICVGCNRTIILLTDEVHSTLRQGRFLSCAHCGCKKIKKLKKTDNLKECMRHSSYKRQRGAVRQVNTE